MANQGLNNLKTIHDMQKDGVLNELIKEIRSSKSLVDSFSQKLQSRLKAIDEEAKLVEKKVEEIKKEITQPVQQKTAPSFSNGNNQQNSFRKFDQNQSNNKFSSQKNNFNREQKKDFRKDGFNKNQNQNQNQKQPFNKQNKKFGNNFVSTKTNNFRSFASNDAPEIDNKAERSYAIKAKMAQKHSSNNEERKTQNKKLSTSRKNNIFIEDENGFEEISYGSRKSYIKKRKDEVKAPTTIITHAIMTSKEFTVKEFSEKIGKPVNEIVKKLMLLGIMATINSNIDSLVKFPMNLP